MFNLEPMNSSFSVSQARAKSAYEDTAKKQNLRFIQLREAVLFTENTADPVPPPPTDKVTKDDFVVSSFKITGFGDATSQVVKIDSNIVLPTAGNIISSGFEVTGTPQISYDDKNNDGAVDGYFPVVRARDLAVYWWDAAQELWVIQPSVVDNTNHVVSATTNNVGLFALGVSRAPGVSVKDARGFPNPYTPKKGGSYDAPGITFDKLPANSVIHIYTITGVLVRELDETDADGVVVWDTKNTSGDKVGSGVYFARITGTGGHKVIKIAIER
jgi:hypothetical protein